MKTANLPLPTTLEEIAQCIHAHFQRFERDPRINKRTSSNSILPFYNAGASANKKIVHVTYISFQLTTKLSKDEALAYLAWLDAGNIGTHYEQQREAKP